MLVSSIGYFKPLTALNRDYVVNSQANKINLNEGFGHVNEEKATNETSFFSRLIDSCQALFSKDNPNNESKKYLSLIG